MSCRYMIVSPVWLASLLKSLPGPTTSDLPDDVRVRDVQMKKDPIYDRWDIVLLLESDTWEAPPEGQMFPIINPLFTVASVAPDCKMEILREEHK